MSSVFAWLRRGRGISFYAACVVGFMVLVIVQGAVVRATGSGNGCGNHWPLCNGDFVPHHPRIATIIEFMHRSLTGICSTLVVVLIGWTFLALPSGHPARRAVVWTGILLITEGALGALLVKGGYVEANASVARVVVQCIHFSNTLLLLAAMTITWWRLRERHQQPLAPHTRTIAWIALGSTIVVGATGSVAALADTLFPSTTLSAALLQDFAANAPLLIRMRWMHPAAAVVGLGCAVWLSANLRSRLGHIVLGLIALQIILGVSDVLLLAPTWMQVLHLLGADLYWIALVAACSGVLSPKPIPATGQQRTLRPTAAAL
jgi:cytochrome c oxidase assembly protein subunit 15